MALQPLPPIPNTRLIDAPDRDAIWRRYLEQVFALLSQVNNTGVVGPGSSTDNAIVRWNGTTGQAIQNSGVIVDDANSITGVSSFSAINGIFSGAVSSSTLNVTSNASITGTLTVSSLTAARIPYTGTGGLLSTNDALQYASATSTLTATNISTLGTLTVGDAATDVLNINSSTWTINSNFIATRAAGTVAAGVVNLQSWNPSATGNSAGTSNIRFNGFNAILSGANAIADSYAQFSTMNHTGTSTVAAMQGALQSITISAAGNATNTRAFLAAISLTSSGTITTADNYLCGFPTLSATGAITTHNGYRAANLGHASLVTNAIGFQADNFTAAATLTVSFRSAQNSGTGVWGFLHTGTANNAFNGNVRIGSTVAPTVALDVTGTAAISGGISLNTASKVSAYTYTGSDYAIYANASGAAFTLTVPHASSLPNKVFVAKKTDSSGNAVTVSSVSNIDGATTTSLAAQFTKIMFQSDGTQWYEI